MNIRPVIPNSSYANSPQQMSNPPAVFVRGMSDESKLLAELIKNVIIPRQDPITFQVRAFDNSSAWKQAVVELNEIKQNCTRNNWDNAGSAKVESQTVKYAQELIERMPNNLPLPEISPDPDGNINLEWYADKDFVFEISVDRNKNLYYAGRLPGQKISGREEFMGTFPEIVERHLRQFINRL